MKVNEAMTYGVHMIPANASIEETAQLMAQQDVGFLPVHENDRLIGMITDRDIVVRCLAQGKGGEVRVRDVMTKDVKYCFEDDDIGDVVQNMGEIQVRRLPVMSRDKRLIGVISIADAALAYGPSTVGEALTAVVAPGGQHTGMQRH
ncbi:MAG: CBS domain-containing protein [Proteobacteria bacterium]|nr:CBS domain-containing protein [Pseudomonadota bacterium]